MGTAPKFLSDDYYQQLLTSEYRLAPNFNNWMQSVLSLLLDISYVLYGMDGNFDLDTAVGVQLDVLGAIVGVSRTVPFQPSGGVNPILDDTTYRLLIKATIANNHWDGTIESLYPIWKTLFPGGKFTIIDNQDMTATVVLTGSFTSIIQDLVKNEMIVPRPETVAYTYLIGDLPMFGFDRNDTFVAGFDVGKWS